MEITKMPSAYVLFNVSPGLEDQVLVEAKKLGNIQEAYVSYGVYDLVLKIRTNTMEELKDDVSRKIRSIDKVRSTLTLMMVEE